MLHIVIVGGGIAGLSAATILSDLPNVKISIYEKEYQIGGQACSEYNGSCFSEYSWRIYGAVYFNLLHILTKIDALKNFEKLDNTCFIDGKNASSAYLGSYNQIYNLFKYSNIDDYYKLVNLTVECKDRLLNEYQNVNALEYFNNNPIAKTIMGPFLGMDANRVSLSGAMKNIISTCDNTEGTAYISKYPTQQALFEKWDEYLRAKGVTIYTNHSLQNISIANNKIENITVNDKIIQADEYVFACSLEPLIKIIEKSEELKRVDTFRKFPQLKAGLQLYFTINMYFSEKLAESDECRHMVIVDMPWQPIIQKKRGWGDGYMKKCKLDDTKIKDVWNVGFLDNNKGAYNNKMVSECSIQEAIEEGVSQVKNSEYVKTLLSKNGLQFDDLYIGADYWYQFTENNLGKLISENPKYSINTGVMENMPSNHNADLPENMYLAGYYVNSSMGGVSMEASCETGLMAGKQIIDKHNIPYEGTLPMKHTNENILDIFMPFILLDKLLYLYKLPPVTLYLNSFILVVVYLIVLIILLFFIIRYALSIVSNLMIVKKYTKYIRKFIL